MHTQPGSRTARLSPAALKQNIHKHHVFLGDTLVLVLAAYLSFVLRLESLALGIYQNTFFLFALISVVVVQAVLALVGTYRRYWFYATISEFMLLARYVVLGSALSSLLVWGISQLVSGVATLPLSVPIIFFLLVMGGIANLRLLLVVLERHRPRRIPHRGGARSRQHAPLRTLIMGAGDAGNLIAREVQRLSTPDVTLIGFVDDDPRKHRMHICDLPVLGDRHALPDLIAAHDIQQVIIAMPSVPGKTVREILAICAQEDVHTRVIPGLSELLDNDKRLQQARDVQIEDLLRRKPISTDITALHNLLGGKRVLVTGGGGSIGSVLCRQILINRPAELILLGHGENSVFEAENALRKQLAETPQPDPTAPLPIIRAVIADIRFPQRMQAVFAQYQPQIVFHAAAHKHVPLMEQHPTEAITNNVLGTRNLLEAAKAVGVERFVMISTDKAVNPTSIMGASKRVAELLVNQAAQETGRSYVAVRFGNVLGSRGSVVLTFQKQIAAGGPITVTHPDIQRFFMTIPEAVQLVLQAATLGKGQEVFTLDMGEQIKIVDLARDLIQLSGLEVGEDIEIQFTGLRPGEKLYEELFLSSEQFQRTTHEKIFLAEHASAYVPPDLTQQIRWLQAAAERGDTHAILLTLDRLIPQHQIKQVLALQAQNDSIDEPSVAMPQAIVNN